MNNRSKHLPDEDMKIATDKPSQDIQHSFLDAGQETAGNLIQEIQQEMQSGKLDSAKQLGANISAAVCSGDIRPPEGYEDLWNNKVLEQSQLLLAFAVASGLDEVTQSELTARTALSTFYDSLKTACPSLYDCLNSSAAISMYYLAFRRGGNIDRNIGDTFAALCHQENNPRYCAMGKELYVHFLAMIHREASHMNLARD